MNIRIIAMCLALIAMLAACNEKKTQEANPSSEQQVNNEMAQAAPASDDQDEWIRQTTIMSSKPMVIDFYSTSCEPCRRLAPILDDIEHNHKGEIIFRRIDVEKDPALAQEFNVMAIPTLMFITPKGEYQVMVGLQPQENIEGKIALLLSKSAK